MNSDTVLIESYEVEASIGVFDWEKEVKQRLVFDLELFGDFSKACQSDDIDDAVDYTAVCAEIDETINQGHFELLEALAEKIAQHILAKFPLESLVLSIRKPGAVPEAKSVGFRIQRGQRS